MSTQRSQHAPFIPAARQTNKSSRGPAEEVAVAQGQGLEFIAWCERTSESCTFDQVACYFPKSQCSCAKTEGKGQIWTGTELLIRGISNFGCDWAKRTLEAILGGKDTNT